MTKTSDVITGNAYVSSLIQPHCSVQSILVTLWRCALYNSFHPHFSRASFVIAVTFTIIYRIALCELWIIIGNFFFFCHGEARPWFFSFIFEVILCTWTVIYIRTWIRQLVCSRSFDCHWLWGIIIARFKYFNTLSLSCFYLKIIIRILYS